MKLWGGRFEKQTAKEVDDFHSSISFDYKLYRQDIVGSIVHAKMLGNQGIINKTEAQMIVSGLEEILQDIDDGKVEFDVSNEDIHMQVEFLLIQKIGEVGKKLHTGRSRNDQVALDLRMYVKERIDEIVKLLLNLEMTLVNLANQNLLTIMPGYTHLQRAQPITLAHHLMAYFEMFRRDIERMLDCKKRVDAMPLGSGALAATTYPLDRQWVAQELGFSTITRNSLDGVSDRDFVIEFLGCCALIMMHLSRFCEELIIWSSQEFQFIEIDDAYSTGSSIMPQKKNPDVAELIRGKTGRVYGNLMAMLTVMKALPLAYNKDMQEDKEALFDSTETIMGCLEIFTNMISTIEFLTHNMYEQSSKGFTNATDAADYLVSKGLPFRAAHEIVGRLVLYCIDEEKGLLDLSLDEFKEFCPAFEMDVYEALSLETCVSQRNLPGGPARSSMKMAIEEAKSWLDDHMLLLQ